MMHSQLITLCGDHIRSKIIAKLFSILADKVTYTSNKEMSLVIRSFDGTNIKDRFVDFIECEHFYCASIDSIEAYRPT